MSSNLDFIKRTLAWVTKETRRVNRYKTMEDKLESIQIMKEELHTTIYNLDHFEKEIKQRK